MRRQLRGATLAALALLLPVQAAWGQASQPGPDTPLPLDPRVTVGNLENGLRYYVRANQRPENRAELRLVVNAGSVLEAEHERGLAHYVEHMAFNGTKNFERQALVEYLESIGMRFGPDLNAYTSFDETVYMLTIPLDDPEVVTTAFQILGDWATNLLFDPEDVEKERGVIIEEWRVGRGAQARIMDQQIPVLLQGSRYAERLPIGVLETIEAATPEILRAFYERWYRPDQMAVIAVGDFDPAAIKALIREHFSGIPMPAEVIERPQYEVPHHDHTLFHAATDPEMPVTRIEVLHKQPPRQPTNLIEYRQSLIERAFSGILNERFREITQNPNPPFLQAISSRGGFVHSADAFMLLAIVADGGGERGLEALMTEAERVARHGFTTGELDRFRLNLLRSLERAHAERERTNSAAFANTYVQHFLRGSPAPGIEFEYQLAQALLPTITLAEVDRLAREWITEENRVVLVSGPEKEGATLPTGAQLRAVMSGVQTASIDPYEDATSDEPLLAEVPAPGRVVGVERHEVVDVIEWRLDNGVRVLLKTTDFRDDEIVMRAYSPGGLSTAPEEHHLSASFAAQMVQASGVGSFSAVNLQRALAGRAANVTPFIDGFEQGFAGNSSNADLETLFQLVHLYFTAPRYDEGPVASLVERQRSLLANRSLDPMSAFADTLQLTLSQHHPRFRPPTADQLDELDVEYAHAFYRSRFEDASDFTFVFVGNLDLEALEPLVLTYLATLPSTGRADSWRDTGVRRPAGVIERVVRQGLEPRSITSIVFSGPFEPSLETSYALSSLASVLRIRLREVLREGMGGTYGVQVSANSGRRPTHGYTVNVTFGTDPDRLEDLVSAVFEQIEEIKTNGPRDQDLIRVREIQRRERETNLRQNGFWVGQLVGYDRDGLDFADILTYDQRVDSLSADLIRDAARQWLRTDNYVRVSLLPAEASGN